MEPIRIFISGDFAPKYRVINMIEEGNYQSLYNDMLPVIQKSDYAITNLESPLGDTVSPIKKTGPNLIAPLKTVEALRYAGFDMVTLANNHALDQGKLGLRSTLHELDAKGICHIGAGMNTEAITQVGYVKLKGKQIAFINCCENEWSTLTDQGAGCNALNEVDLYYQIKEAERNADYCILIIHGGHETFEYPSPRMVKLYRWFIDLGVDAVIGHHTHCYSGREIYKEKPIIYSLGNFVFDHATYRNSFWNHGCACVLSIWDHEIGIEMIPFYQCDQRVGIHLYNMKEQENFLKTDIEKTAIIVHENQLMEIYQSFLNQHQSRMNAYLEPYTNRILRLFQKKHLFPNLLSHSKRLLLMNLVRCEAHRDVLLDHLKRTSK